MENAAVILSDIKEAGYYNEFIQIALDIMEAYHKNWDGGENTLAAQIIALADAYCLLTKEAGSDVDEVFARLEKDAGIKYNSEIFAIMKKIKRQLK